MDSYATVLEISGAARIRNFRVASIGSTLSKQPYEQPDLQIHDYRPWPAVSRVYSSSIFPCFPAPGPGDLRSAPSNGSIPTSLIYQYIIETICLRIGAVHE